MAEAAAPGWPKVPRGWRAFRSEKIILNLGEVQYIDSSGVGELVNTHTTVRNQGGQLRLINLNQRVSNLLEMTRLVAVFDIARDEAGAMSSLQAVA